MAEREFRLKRLSPAGLQDAFAKVERYRLLNEPWQAESICRDILEAEPGNQDALVSLLLSITDRFASEGSPSVEDARALLPRLQGEYERAYYAGIICERRAWALMQRAAPGSPAVAYDWLVQAMDWYEKAEPLRPSGNESALLRWNTCARAIQRGQGVQPPSEPGAPELLE